MHFCSTLHTRNFLTAGCRVRNALIYTSILVTLLKLDFYFVFSFAAQLIPSQKLQYDETVTETVLVFALGALGLSVALLSVYRENKYNMAFFIVMGIGAIAYLVYRLVRIAIPRPADTDPYNFTRRFLLFTVVVAMALILITIAAAVKCFLNLHRGIYVFAHRAAQKKAHPDRGLPIDQSSSEEFDITHISKGSTIEAEHQRLTSGHGNNHRQPNDMWTIE